MRKFLRTVLLCAMIGALLLQAAGCAYAGGSVEDEPVYPRFSMSFFDTFDTLITIMAYAPDEETFKEVTDEAHAMFQRLHRLYDNYTAYEGINNLFMLNREAAKGPVQVEPELMDLLVFCRDNQRVTQGTVNIALGSVLEIWHTYREDGIADPAHAQLPPMAELRAAAAHTDINALVLDTEQNTVFYSDPLLRLDLGAVAKGYAAELVSQWMLTSAIPSFIVNAGGNVRVGKPPMDGERVAWGIGIQDPRGDIFSAPSEDNVESFFVSNMSIVSSGDYQRFYVVDGKRYHHLIDPVTLMPGENYQAVTVLTENSGMADLLSTAAFILPYAQSRAFVESLDGVEALWVMPDGAVEMTEGAKIFAKSAGATSLKPK